MLLCTFANGAMPSSMLVLWTMLSKWLRISAPTGMVEAIVMTMRKVDHTAMVLPTGGDTAGAIFRQAILHDPLPWGLF